MPMQCEANVPTGTSNQNQDLCTWVSPEKPIQTSKTVSSMKTRGDWRRSSALRDTD